MARAEDWSIEDLLERLATPAAGEAWKAFLRKFTPLLVSICQQYHHDEQRLRDCYLFVCEKLCDDAFARLRTYQKVQDARFSSWLRAVTANLCVDWLRGEFGRQRRFRAIQRLPELEQAVYEQRYEQGLSIAECYEALSVKFPELTEVRLAGVIRRVNSELTSRQHWLLSRRGRAVVSFDDPEIRREASLATGGGDDPESSVLSREEVERVDLALQKLESDQRVLLKLRFQQGLTLKEVARLAGLTDAFQARYQLQLALDQLRKLLTD
ncbi:MAG: sigma-70 family RNA polymerase sigma factor [Lysobacterales bacterium]